MPILGWGAQRQTVMLDCVGRKVWRHPTRVKTNKCKITHNQVTQKHTWVFWGVKSASVTAEAP